MLSDSRYGNLFAHGARQIELLIEVHYIQNEIGSAIQQYDVPGDQNVRAIGRRRRQAAHQFLRTGLDPLLQARR